MEEIRVFRPQHDALSAVVESIWTLRSEGSVSPYLLPPDASFTCVFSFDHGTTVRSASGAGTALGGDFCAGIRTKPVTLNPSGPIDYVAVQLKPLGFRALFGLDAMSVTDAFIDLRYLSAGVRRARQTILDACPAAQRRDGVEQALVSMIRPDVFTPPLYLSRAVERIHGTHGNLRIGTLCDEIGVTRRQLQREFSRWIGVPAKFYARVVRANRALQLLQSEKHRGHLGELAVALGYYDQAHLNSEFSELVGISPRMLSCGEMG